MERHKEAATGEQAVRKVLDSVFLPVVSFTLEKLAI